MLIKNEATRAWLYRLVAPLTALAIAYGLVDDVKGALWAALAGTVLTGGLAVANTTTKTLPPDEG